MSALPPVGTIWYNGFTFSEAAETKDLQVRPVYDSSGRTIMYSVVSITIVDYIAVAVGQDLTSLGAVIALTQPAAGFIYNGRGTSGIEINVGAVGALGGATNAWDVVWGPRPRMLSMKPLGGGNAVRFEWAVDIAIPTCAGATYFGFEQPLAYNYKLEFSIDKGGYTTRRYSGHVMIPQTRRDINNRVPYASADQWREQINPPLLPGYRRTPGTFTLSEDRNRLDFVITDEQFPSRNIMPAGCIEAAANHSFVSKSANVLFWTGTISGSYELAAGLSSNVALNPFIALIQDRIRNAAGMRGPANLFGIPIAGAGKPVGIFPIQFSLSEDKIYDKPTASFSCTYTVLAPDLTNILARGGLFRPVPGSNWKLWSASVGPILGSRGISGLAFVPSQDAILDLCVVAQPKTPPPTPSTTVELRSDPGGPAILTAGKGIALLFPPPTPEASWVDYECSLAVETESNLVVGSTLPPSPLSQGSNSGVWEPLTQGLPLGNAQGATFFPQANDVGLGQPGSQNSLAVNTTFTQQRAAPILYVTLSGHAVRAGFKIPIPQLLSVGGQMATPCGRADHGEGFEEVIIGNVGVPLVVAKWRLRYVLTGTPTAGSFQVPGNQLLGA